ncbi:sortilin-related receptor-like isoform X2 [Eurosta solidaginis]|uniref:sortilin-related receptor-like isoform X2 n=1 Tax=Eurosta solidaginis TaxID=178769 RepID=UPI003530EA48
MFKYLKYIFFIELAICHLEALAFATNDTWSCNEEETIPLSKLCDGNVDCSNGRDETAKACIYNTCKDDQYRCAYGGCVKANTKCDREIHCIDRSDETEFLCESDENVWKKLQGYCTDEEYQCQSGECIELITLCDGKPDCKDASDETVISCAHLICPNYSFRCGYGACISIKQVCDNVWDCTDGSDELCSMSWNVFKPKRDRSKFPRYSNCTMPYDNVHLQVIHSTTNKVLNYLDRILPNHEVEFKCSPGFILNGIDRLVCNMDNNWYRQWPNCTRPTNIPSCNSNEMACDNGDCIHMKLLCDGVKNCKDGSDETALKCLNRTCTSSEFQCKYGACVSTRQICDDVRHCADGSDETKLLCTKNDDEYFKIVQGACISTDDEDLAKCRSGECISLSLFCDGTPHCADRSDETVEMCAHMNCTNTSFTCAYGACVPSTAHCDGRMDCVDGSDEIAEICATIAVARAKHDYEFNFNDNYASNIDRNEAKEERRLYAKSMRERNEQDTAARQNYDTGSANRYCTIPVDRVGLRAATDQEELKIGSRVKIGSIVKFLCEESWQPVNEESELLCMHNGVWSGEVPTCSKRCPPLTHGISKIVRCKYRQKVVDCTKEYHQPGTEATIYCANGYRRNMPRSSIYCDSDGEWQTFGFKCEPKCMELSQTEWYHPENKAFVNIFRLNTNNSTNRNYEAAFNGTVISPKMVLTCKADNPVIGREETPAIFVLVNYFSFSLTRIMPICLKFSRSCMRITQDRGLTIKQRDSKGLAYILNDCFVVIGQNGLIFMDKYQQWLEMQIMRYKHLLV